jgi:hypothetical protein
MQIFRIKCDQNGYKLTEEAEKAATAMFNELYENRSENFGNGRDVRNCFEDMIVNQSNRVAKMENPSKDDLMTVLPEDLEEIGIWAFAGCTALKSIEIPDPVEIIGDYAFAYCQSMESITLPEDLETVGPHTFDQCPNLKGLPDLSDMIEE